ncbi:MAG TPA: VPDSG-CTERM sorting domain-containing protein [Methylomirabilota bacterium]|nr:VPDSG-CTERM sorting domain-containing protein [Methylomirabilota bacterium]
MMTPTHILRSALTALALALLHSAQAVPTTFFGEDLNTSETTRLLSRPNSDAAAAQFLSQLVGVGTETFEGFSDGQSVPLALSFPGSIGSITATLSGSGVIDDLPGTGTADGRYPISGTKYLQNVIASSGGGALTLNFSSAVAAFGFYGTDFGDFNGIAELQLIDGGTTTVSIGNSVSVPGGSTLFFGVINPSQPFTSIVFRNSNPSDEDQFGFDNMTIGDVQQVQQTVPDGGATLLLLLGALGALFGFKRRLAV